MLTIMSPLLVPLAASCATGCFLCHWLLLVPLAASCATGCLQPVLLLLLRRNRRTRRRSRRGSRLLTRSTAAVPRVSNLLPRRDRRRVLRFLLSRSKSTGCKQPVAQEAASGTRSSQWHKKQPVAQEAASGTRRGDMIVSMTGFGDATAERNGVHYVVEIRALNNRF